MEDHPTLEPASENAFEPDYLVALDEIYHNHWVAAKMRRIALLREAVAHFWPDGHPARLIHVTGTNGKGSVAHYLEQGLRFAGPTGSWTGPHVFDYAERFHLNGKRVSHDDIARIYHRILRPYQETVVTRQPGEGLGFAGLGILLALHLFAEKGVKWGIMEVGAGGRYTPLTALDPAACVLTNIGDDHPKTLGSEIWQRALEKAGMARSGVPFFTAAKEPALGYVRKTAEAAGAPVQCVTEGDIGAVAEVVGEQPPFKLRNLALATRVIRHFYPDFRGDGKEMEKMGGLLPGRFRRVAPNIIADMSHNRDKIRALADQLRVRFPGRKFRFLIGLTRNRDVREVFAPILELAEYIVMTGASYAGQSPHDTARLLSVDFPAVSVVEDPQTAFENEKNKLGKDDILVLTGSGYMIDQALNPNPYIKHLNATYGRRTADNDAGGVRHGGCQSV